MIDVTALRDHPEETVAALGRRGVSRDEVESLIELDQRRREVVTEVEGLRAEQNKRSRAIGQAEPDEREQLIASAQELKQTLEQAEEELSEVDRAMESALADVPNLPHPQVPAGGEDDSVELERVGQPPDFDFQPRDHVELMEAGGALDLERAAKVSGARFGLLKGDGALLELALVRYAMDVVIRHGHVPVMPPVLVRREAMYGTGFLPTDEQQIFRTDDRDDYYLVGTSEVPLAGMHADEILEDLPRRYAAFSTCFRREAGSYGQDTRGMFRVHQFDKVEMFAFVEPAISEDEHDRLVSIQREIMNGLDLAYRVVDIAIGDLGASAARKFDLEAWMPGQQAFREITSCSNTTGYQARRLAIRHRPDSESSTQTVHTLNGTALAVQRTIIALVEQHQRADGTVAVPSALQPYLRREVLLSG